MDASISENRHPYTNFITVIDPDAKLVTVTATVTNTDGDKYEFSYDTYINPDANGITIHYPGSDNRARTPELHPAKVQAPNHRRPNAANITLPVRAGGELCQIHLGYPRVREWGRDNLH